MSAYANVGVGSGRLAYFVRRSKSFSDLCDLAIREVSMVVRRVSSEGKLGRSAISGKFFHLTRAKPSWA